LQSGEDSNYELTAFCGLITKIRDRLGLVVTLGLGEKAYRDLKAFRDAGAQRYLLKFETSDKKLYRRLKPDSCYAARFRCLAALKKLGYQTGSGNMVGLPGQSLNVLVEDILLFKELALDMIGIGPFISHKDTPLAGEKNGDLGTTLKIVALTRINVPYANIPATTAVGTIDKLGRQRALQAGANIVMPNLTPAKYRKYYQIYPDKICLNDTALTCAGCVGRMINSLGRKVGAGPGHSIQKP
jgi:biotin synthase